MLRVWGSSEAAVRFVGQKCILIIDGKWYQLTSDGQYVRYTVKYKGGQIQGCVCISTTYLIQGGPNTRGVCMFSKAPYLQKYTIYIAILD